MTALARRQAIRLYQFVTGRRILDRLAELDRTQWLDRDELVALQRDRLHKLLVYAQQYVPYYRRVFAQTGFEPDEVLSDPTSLSKLPLLNKDIIRRNFDDLLTTESTQRAGLRRLTTGGSTGRPLSFMQDTRFRDNVTADILRHLEWADWQFGQCHAYIWGANFEVSTSQSLRTKLMDWALNRFVTNAYMLSEEGMNDFADRIRRRRPRVLFGYASGLHRFARFVRHQGYDIVFDAIFSSAEVLYPVQRRYIEETFHCRVFDRYGARDLGGIASECDAHTGLHVSVENVFLEILRDDQPARPGETGEVVGTNLNNYGMPFIRYSNDDTAAWHEQRDCSCGRELPMIELIGGRRMDMFKTRDGHSVWGGFASPLFAMDGVKQFQVVQKSLDLVVVHIVKESELDQAQLDRIERTVKVAMGDDTEIRFEFPEMISVVNSGKYLYTISEVI